MNGSSLNLSKIKMGSYSFLYGNGPWYAVCSTRVEKKWKGAVRGHDLGRVPSRVLPIYNLTLVLK